MQIESSGVQKNGLLVNATGELLTNSVTRAESSEASRAGNHYNINTGDITLTNANKSAVFYLKNNESRDLVVTVTTYLIGNSTGGTGDLVVDIIQNPTAGTIVSTATDVEMVANKNFGNTQTLDAAIYKGAQGATMTTGTKAYSSRLKQTGAYAISTGDIELPKGASLGIDITPPTSNTSMVLQVALAVYLRDIA